MLQLFFFFLQVIKLTCLGYEVQVFEDRRCILNDQAIEFNFTYVIVTGTGWFKITIMYGGCANKFLDSAFLFVHQEFQFGRTCVCLEMQN